MNVQAWPLDWEDLQVDRRLDTFLSVLYFADEYVYKVKRPVKRDAVDFTTLALREKACAREVRLNQRFSNSPHLDALPIFETNGRWTLHPVGEPVEYCVRMRRLPSERMLNRLVQDGTVQSEEIDRLALLLADFYREAKTSEKISRACISNSIETNLRSALKTVREAYPDLTVLDFLDSALLEYVATRKNLFADRVETGRIRDCHGDLRLEHFCVTETPVVFDCVEFQDRLRHVDILDDVAGLAMEFDRVGRGELGDQFSQKVFESIGEKPPETLFDFYKAYRAIIRARFEAIQVDDEQAKKDRVLAYLDQAALRCRRFHKTRLLVTFGLLGTGKSTLSQALANTIGIKRLSSETLREKMFANGNGTSHSRRFFTKEERMQVYEHMFDLTRETLASGASVILDGSFTTNYLRKRAIEVADQAGAEPYFFECRLSNSDAIARLDQRFKRDRTNMTIRPDQYEEHLRTFEASDQLSAEHLKQLTTTVTVPELVEAVIETMVAEDKT